MPMISKSGRFRKMSKKAEMAVYDYNLMFFGPMFKVTKEHLFLMHYLIDWAEDGHGYVGQEEAMRRKDL